MWYPATISVAAEAEPVTASLAKAHLRVDHSDDDTIIAAYIASARAHVERYCGARFASQTLVVKCDGFDDFARLSEAPVTSVSSVAYVDTDGTTQTLSTDVYELRADGLETSIALKYEQTWPAIRTGSRITVTLVAGYATAPETVKQAMLLLIAAWYENREAGPAGELAHPYVPPAFDALLANERRYA